MKTVALVPVKSISERVKSKNFRDFFNGKSLFDILLDKLIKSNVFDEIYISSNSLEAKEKATSLGLKFLQRDDSFCNNEVPWSDVIAHIAETIPEDKNTTLAWCHTTSPTFNRYDEAINTFHKLLESGSNDGLVSVIKSSDFIVSEKLIPINYSWGPWHRYSQNLEKYYYITYALFVSSIESMIKNRYVISKNPHFFEVKPIEAIDIDSEYDFELAKILMENISNLSRYD